MQCALVAQAGGDAQLYLDESTTFRLLHPLVQQFVQAQAEGPVHFHYPGPSVEDDFGQVKVGRS